VIDPDLAFIARSLKRLTTEVGSLRDDMRVLTAIVIRLDHTTERLQRLLLDGREETARMGDSVRKLENTDG
jgi:hypothetical protein